MANLKSASTAIEAALRPIAEIALPAPTAVKHQPLRVLLTRFRWLLNSFDLEKFLIFGVIRDPVDYVLSLYNSHQKDEFKEYEAIYTKGVPFDKFFESWTKRDDWQMSLQHKRFLDPEGNIGANYIISYDKLTEGLLYVATRLNEPKLAELARYNDSPGYLARDALSEAQIAQIKKRFAADYAFMAQYCNRLLSPEERLWTPLAQSSGPEAGSPPNGNRVAADITGAIRVGEGTKSLSVMTRGEVEKFVACHRWFHSIDLGDGIVTPGGKSRNLLEAEAAAVFAPLDLVGRTVMDVGAWNGYYTVESKRRGALDVLAVDSPTWLRPDLRGKETFDFVMKRLGLSVKARVQDVQSLNEAAVGRWDVVLFLGVFYHLVDPIAALMRLAAVAKEVLVVETHLDLRNYKRPGMVFYPGRELGNDPNNWWGPNQAAVEGLLRHAGFKQVKFTPHPVHQVRGIFHAYKSDDACQRHSLAAERRKPLAEAAAE